MGLGTKRTDIRVAKIIAEHDNEIGFTLLGISSSQAECHGNTSNKQAEEFHLLPCGVILSMPGISHKPLAVFHVCNSTAAIVVISMCFICQRRTGGGVGWFSYKWRLYLLPLFSNNKIRKTLSVLFIFAV